MTNPRKNVLARGILMLCIWSRFGLTVGRAAAVQVRFDKGTTEIATLNEGVQYFSNHNWQLQNLPGEAAGLQFTRRPGGEPSNVRIDVAAGTTVYLLVDSDAGPNHAEKLDERLTNSGWTRIAGDAEYIARGVKKCSIAVFKMDVGEDRRLELKGATWAGFVVAANDLALTDVDQAPDRQPEAPAREQSVSPAFLQTDVSGDGPTTRISKLQSSIEALYVEEQPSGEMLGLSSRLFVTALRGDSRRRSVPVSFATPVGNEMKIVLDETLRALDLRYRIAGVERIDFSFEDKYSPKDGGSIGAAIGTLMLSLIEGFDIDPKVAVTGDVSADASILRIGGVAAKLRGAIEGGCTIVAIPAANLEQVRDALIYEGPELLERVQVIGIDNLDDAAALCRVDRSPSLSEAIDLFADAQRSVEQNPQSLSAPSMLAKLQKVTKLAPNHFSARLLMLAGEKELPRLSAAASEYYTFVAVREYLATLGSTGANGQVPQYATEAALSKLGKLRPLSDLTIARYIDAWADYIRALDQWRHGAATARFVDQKVQEIQNEEAKIGTNRDLAEKMLRQGI